MAWIIFNDGHESQKDLEDADINEDEYRDLVSRDIIGEDW